MGKAKEPREPLDVAGNILKVDDYVAIVIPQYSEMLLGVVERITPQGFSVITNREWESALRTGRKPKTTFRTGRQIVKYTPLSTRTSR